MIDPTPDGNASKRLAASSPAPPPLPPVLPPPFSTPAGAGQAARIEARRRGSAWKWAALGVLVLGTVGVFVGQTVFSHAEGTVAVRPGRSEAGVRHWNDRVDRVPWSIHIIEIDRTRKDLGFYTPLAMGHVLGVSRVSDMARAVPKSLGKAVAAVNGDFYERDNRAYAGDPRGLQIVDGEIVSSPSTVAVWFDPNGDPQIGDVREDFLVTWSDGKKLDFAINQQRRPNSAVLYTSTYGDSTRVAGGKDLILEKSGDGPWLPLKASETYTAKVREIATAGNTRLEPGFMVLSIGPQLGSKIPGVQVGDTLSISTRLIPDLKGVPAAIAGGPAIVQNSKPFADREPPDGSSGNYSERSKYERHPRSAVGWNAQKLYLITVDGRQPGLSVGMTLAELGEYMVTKLKCTDGMNFDGGASSCLWMGSIVNDPCQGERAVANSLVVYRKPGAP